MNEEEKKLDNLIKIGVGLVLLSVIVFATTNWNVLSSITKLLLLVVFSFLFYGLSVFTKKKLKLEKSSFMYYVLSTIMIVALLVAIGYYDIFGQWYSFDGDGSLILFSSIFLLCGLFFYSYNNRMKNTILELIGFNFIYLSVVVFHSYFIDDLYNVLFILSIYLTLLSIILKDKIKSCYLINTKVLLYLGFYLFCNICFKFSILYLIEVLLYLLFLSYLYFKGYGEKNSIESIFNPLSFIFATSSIVNCIEIDSYKICFFFISIVSLILYIVGNKFINKKEYIYFSFIIHAISIIVYSLYAISSTVNAFSLIIIIISILVSYLYINEIKYEKYLIILKILLFIICLINFIDISKYILPILLIVFSFLSYFGKDIYSKISYIIYNALIIIGVLCFSSFETDILIYGMLPLTICLSLYIYSIKYEKYKRTVFIIGLILFLKLFLFNSVYLSLLVNSSLLLKILEFVLLTFCGIYVYTLYKDNSESKIILTLYMVIPILQLCNGLDTELNFSIMYITRIVMSLYFIFLGYYYKKNNFNEAFYLLSFILPLIILFTFYLSFITLLLWVVSIIYIFVGYSNNEFKKLTIYGLVALILSVIINLFAFWSSIPLFVYLFVCGVAIIIFVTKKEYKKANNKDGSDKKEQLENIEKNEKEIINNLETKIENIEIIEENKCNNCGYKLEDNFEFCPKCGNKIK